MKRMLFLVLMLLVYGTLAASDVAEVTKSEKDFSKLAVEKGIRTAFLEYLADDSIVFHGGPVNGKKWYEGRPETPGILYWQPIAAELSAAGDLAYSTGPWEYRKTSMEEKPIAYGTFASIWKKQPDGRFKVAVDLGTSYPSSTVAVSSLESVAVSPVPPGKALNKIDVEKEKASLMQLERDFSGLSREKGVETAYGQWAADGIRMLREGAEPVTGKSNLKPLLPASGSFSWEPVAAGISASGDLGYAYGGAHTDGATPQKGNYLRVWKRQPDGKWRIVLDVVSIEE